MANMRLVEETHTYINDDNPLMKYTSVTTVVHKYAPVFDEDFYSEKVALREGKTKEEVIAEWREINKQANIFGTEFHAILERYLLSKRLYAPRNEFETRVINEFEKLNLIEDSRKVKPEHIMQLPFYGNYGLAGTADVIEDIDVNYFNILDFKGLSLDTEIPTKDGFKLMKDIRVGDNIFDGNGDLTNVQHVSEIHNNPCYKIIFDTNDELICDHEHKWVVTQRAYNGIYNDIELTTEELYQLKSNKKPIRITCVGININDNIDLPIDPYVLGVWLGNGSRDCGIITNMNDKIWSEIENRGYEIGPEVSKGSYGKAYGRAVYKLRTELRKLNLLKNKHIPDLYLRSSYNQRLDLLRGFMDSDGYYNKKRDRCVMITTKSWQAEALAEVISSLGWKPTIINAKTNGFNKKNVKTYHITFKPIDTNPFLCKTEDYLNISRKTTVASKYRYVKEIKKIETVPTKCLSVTSPTKTYLATRKYIKTHNTNKKFNYTSPYFDYLKFPVEHLQACQYNEYALQLSVYGVMYELETGRKANQFGLLYWDRATQSFELIPIPYMKKEAEAIIEHFKINVYPKTIAELENKTVEQVVNEYVSGNKAVNKGYKKL